MLDNSLAIQQHFPELIWVHVLETLKGTYKNINVLFYKVNSSNSWVEILDGNNNNYLMYPYPYTNTEEAIAKIRTYIQTLINNN